MADRCSGAQHVWDVYLGHRGAVLLAQVIEDPAAPPGEPVVLPAHLVVRGSTGPATDLIR
ncbi:hypothetical protein GCM10023162_40400 [Klenkia terrae]